jgi:hypothetical protein
MTDLPFEKFGYDVEFRGAAIIFTIMETHDIAECRVTMVIVTGGEATFYVVETTGELPRVWQLANR